MADKTDKTDKPSEAPVDTPTMTSLPLDPGQLVHIMNQATGTPSTGARARDYEIAIDWLQNYGLIHKIYCVNKVAKPLKSYRDVSTFKIYHLDVGLLGAMGGISETTILENDVLFQEFKGALTEQFAIQQLIPFHLDNLHYWTNQNGSAEIDVLFEHGHSIVPLEVKASENLQSKSRISTRPPGCKILKAASNALGG